MKSVVLLITVCLIMAGQGFGQTNDFYDDAENYQLTINSIEIAGEVSNPGIVDFSKLPLRSVIVKENLLNNGKDKFTGAYRYDGYSLYDILNNTLLQKKNEAEFPPIIDIHVEVENTAGDKVIFSWGEIYYPVHRHEIIIASQVARIVPSKTKELWELPVENKLVVASDLLTERNISNPVKITIKSIEGKFNIVKGMSPMYSDSFSMLQGETVLETLSKLPENAASYVFPAVFYGRGRGIHGTTPFNGVLLKQVLAKYFPVTRENLQRGLFILNGKDGYHGAFTFSEVMNRNDQAEFLIIPLPKNEDGGAFKIFPAADFFSDRAINSLESIRFEVIR